MYDASSFVGSWPFGLVGGCDVQELASRLRLVGFAGAAVSSLDAILAPDPMPANEVLISSGGGIEGFPLQPVPIINPTLANWAQQLEAFADSRAVKVIPSYHGYSLMDPALDGFIEEVRLRRMTLCVQVRMRDERSHPKLMPVPAVSMTELQALATRSPDLTVLACGIYWKELSEVRDNSNIFIEISFVDNGRLPESLIDRFPVGRVLLGTHCPMYNPQAAVAKLRPSDLNKIDWKAITARNYRCIFGHEA